MAKTMENQAEHLPPEVQVGRMILGKFTTHLLYVAARLELADRLADVPRKVDELAVEAEAHGPSLYRVLRALASLGIFTETSPQCFGLTPLAETLRSDSPVSQRSLALFMGSDFHCQAWSNLIHAVKTGEAAFKNRFGMDFFSYLLGNPEAMAALQGVMSVSSEHDAREVIDLDDFSGAGLLVDVGGGQGGLLMKILLKYPDLRGVVIDAPPVAAAGAKALTGSGLEDRLRIVGGDFFQEVPAAGDLYVLKRVLHDWDDDRAVKLLSACGQVMSSGGRVLIIEQIIPPGDGPSFGKLADIEMLVVSDGGRERTEKEFGHIISRAGLRLNRIIPGRSLCILEAFASDHS